MDCRAQSLTTKEGSSDCCKKKEYDPHANKDFACSELYLSSALQEHSTKNSEIFTVFLIFARCLISFFLQNSDAPQNGAKLKGTLYLWTTQRLPSSGFHPRKKNLSFLAFPFSFSYGPTSFPSSKPSNLRILESRNCSLSLPSHPLCINRSRKSFKEVSTATSFFWKEGPCQASELGMLTGDSFVAISGVLFVQRG